MSKRRSGVKRVKRDAYQTREEWVTFALVKFLPKIKRVWECSAGQGYMARTLLKCRMSVYSTDIHTGVEAIITNPPYSLADEFIEHALKLMTASPKIKRVAMLLPIDFDSAKTRKHLFGNCMQYAGKIVLTRRIIWFKLKWTINKKTGKREKHGPSENHAWFIWSREARGLPTIQYYYE